jgi:hypothetical protein
LSRTRRFNRVYDDEAPGDYNCNNLLEICQIVWGG